MCSMSHRYQLLWKKLNAALWNCIPVETCCSCTQRGTRTYDKPKSASSTGIWWNLGQRRTERRWTWLKACRRRLYLQKTACSFCPGWRLWDQEQGRCVWSPTQTPLKKWDLQWVQKETWRHDQPPCAPTATVACWTSRLWENTSIGNAIEGESLWVVAIRARGEQSCWLWEKMSTNLWGWTGPLAALWTWWRSLWCRPAPCHQLQGTHKMKVTVVPTLMPTRGF